MAPAEASTGPSRRRVVLTTFGSLGDLHPYLAVALGHEALLATGECYRQKSRRWDLGFRAVWPDSTLVTLGPGRGGSGGGVIGGRGRDLGRRA